MSDLNERPFIAIPIERHSPRYSAYLTSYHPDGTRVRLVTTNDAEGHAKWNEFCQKNNIVRYSWHKVDFDNLDPRMEVRL